MPLPGDPVAVGSATQAPGAGRAPGSLCVLWDLQSWTSRRQPCAVACIVPTAVTGWGQQAGDSRLAEHERAWPPRPRPRCEATPTAPLRLHEDSARSEAAGLLRAPGFWNGI